MVKGLICYCFQYTADDIQLDYLENGRSTIMEKIQMEKADNHGVAEGEDGYFNGTTGLPVGIHFHDLTGF